jgi:hypothetical protein
VALRQVALRQVALRQVALRQVALRQVALRQVALRQVALRQVALRQEFGRELGQEFGPLGGDAAWRSSCGTGGCWLQHKLLQRCMHRFVAGLFVFAAVHNDAKALVQASALVRRTHHAAWDAQCAQMRQAIMP